MRYLKIITICLTILGLHGTAWAEIYETTDAQGNREFSDSPAGPGAEAIDLQQTNIADAPPEEPQQVSAPQSVADQQVPEQENSTTIIYDRQDSEDKVYDAYLRRDQAFERMDPAAPHEVLDAEAPREVGDSNSQMPDEVGDFDSPAPEQVSDTDAQIVHEADESHIHRRVVHPHRR